MIDVLCRIRNWKITHITGGTDVVRRPCTPRVARGGMLSAPTSRWSSCVGASTLESSASAAASVRSGPSCLCLDRYAVLRVVQGLGGLTDNMLSHVCLDLSVVQG